MRLKDKIAIITGGSRGIGFATADKFLAEGAKVIITASSQASADRAVAQLKEKYPEQRIEIIDSLAASAGEGLIVYLVNEKKKATLNEDLLKKSIAMINVLIGWYP